MREHFANRYFGPIQVLYYDILILILKGKNIINLFYNHNFLVFAPIWEHVFYPSATTFFFFFNSPICSFWKTKPSQLYLACHRPHFVSVGEALPTVISIVFCGSVTTCILITFQETTCPSL